MQGESLVLQLESLRTQVQELRARAASAEHVPATEHILAEVEDSLAELRLLSLPDDLRQDPLEARSHIAREERDGGSGEDALADFLPDPYLVTDRAGIVRRANPAAAAMLGKPLWELIGKPILANIRDGDRRRVRTIIAQMSDLVRVDGSRVCIERSSSDTFTAELTAGAVFDENGSLTSIRWLVRRSLPLSSHSQYEENGTEQAVGEAEPQWPTYTAGEAHGRRLAFLAQASGILARSLNLDHTLVSAAQLALPTLGDLCIVDLVDEHAFSRLHVAFGAASLGAGARRIRLLPPRLHEVAGIATSRFRRGEPLLLTGEEAPAAVDRLLATDEPSSTLLGRPTGSCLLVPLTARGQLLGVLTFIMLEPRHHDGMADVMLGRELGSRAALAADNARLYRMAQRASEAKSNFLAAMSHELRTPLTAVVGYTELLAEGVVGEVTPHQREQLLRIRAASDHLLHIVEEILTYARLDAQRDTVNLEDVDVATVMDQALTLIAPMVQKQGIEVVVDRPDPGFTIRTDGLKLRQILVNLLGNAVKFTAAGEVRLAARYREELVTFDVSDTGMGIAEEHLERIFEPFWQAQQQLTRGYGGTGLGLATARKMARLLGGEVSVTSGPGGSRFRVYLPLRGQAVVNAREMS